MQNIWNIFNCCTGETGIVIEDSYKDEMKLSEECETLDTKSVSIKNTLLPDKHDDLPTLVLDLDSTLVFASYNEPEDYDFRIFVEGNGATIAIFVKERPFLKKMLKRLSGKYEIVIFTASKQVYASQVYTRIGGDKYISHILFRDHCTLVDGNYLKDLSLLGRDLNRTIIVDDAEIAFSLQPQNGIFIKPYLGQDADDELDKLCDRLLNLSHHRDIVSQLNKIEGIPEL